MNAFFAATDTAFNFRGLIGSGPFKGENIDVGQLGIYVQDEYQLSQDFKLTYGLRVDFPMYFTDPVDNPFSRGLTALDENDHPESVDQSKLPGAEPLFSPRVGFNWDLKGDRSAQLRGGTGIFTGRVPFVWIGNVISNPGANPNLYSPFVPGSPQIPTKDDAILQQSFDLNAMDPNFEWPQVWITNAAVDHKLPGDFLGTLEFIYSKDLNAVFMRNSDLVKPVRSMPDGRPYYGGTANFIDASGNFVGVNNFELNPDGGAGIYVIDNTNEGYNYNLTAQLRKSFNFGMNGSLSYSYTQSRSQLKSTEIASVLWQNQPVQGDPNKPELSFGEFGHRHRIVGGATYSKGWSQSTKTHFGLFLEIAEGNRFAGSGGNRYSYIYTGDVNGDGTGGNDLIYIPRDRNDINLAPYVDLSGRTVSVEEQRNALEAFIQQDKYLNSHRGQIAERFGEVNPWYSNIDLRILQDFSFNTGEQKQTFQLNLDVLNVANLLNSDWGVRKIASTAATSPLRLVTDGLGNGVFTPDGAPVLNFTGPSETFIDDPSLLSRWQIQLGLRYFLN